MANEIGDLAALRAERDALKRDNAYMGYVIHGPLLPEQEARATKVERDALRAENERLKDLVRDAANVLEITEKRRNPSWDGSVMPASWIGRARAAIAAKENPDG